MKKPVILNGIETPLKKDFCKVISEINNIPFKEYRFDSFMTELPHVNNENCLLYINDFLVKHGRILNHYEENILLNINKNSNLIVLNTEFKDIHFSPITKKNFNTILKSKNITINDLASLIDFLSKIVNREVFVFLELNKNIFKEFIR
jgi:hypothetical protein